MDTVKNGKGSRDRVTNLKKFRERFPDSMGKKDNRNVSEKSDVDKMANSCKIKT